MQRRQLWIGAIVILFGVVIASLWNRSALNQKRQASAMPTSQALEPVTINEAVRTLLYLPLYHAAEAGYFRDQGIDVHIVTGGTATNSFAAMLNGSAQFSQADPMYVPISRQNGAHTKVVAQVVGRIAVWAVTRDQKVQEISKATLRGKTIATQPRPMTAYTYAVKTIRDVGLRPDTDVRIMQMTAGAEIVPLMQGTANFTFTLEPNTSTAVSKGAHVVLSYPQLLGDQVFTGLMTTDQLLRDRRQLAVRVVAAYQRALDDIHAHPERAALSAKKYFPQLSDSVLQMAIHRLAADGVWPTSVVVPEESWNKAVQVRIAAGDIKAGAPLDSNADIGVMREASGMQRSER